MAKVEVILHGVTTSNEGDVFSLQFAASPSGLILNKFRIYNRWHIQWREPCQLPDWMKNSSYYSAMAGIWTSDLSHSMTMCKKVPQVLSGIHGFLVSSKVNRPWVRAFSHIPGYLLLDQTHCRRFVRGRQLLYNNALPSSVEK